MSTSQLLQILPSLPSDVKQNSSSIYDPAEQDTRMNGNHNTMLYNHGNYWGEVNSPTSEGKGAYQLNDERNERVFVPFIEFGRRDAARWNPFVASFSVGIENGSKDSSETEYPNGRLNSLDSGSLFSKLNEEFHHRSSPEAKNGLKESTIAAARDGKDSRRPNPGYLGTCITDANSLSCKRKVQCDTVDAIDPSKEASDRIPEDLPADKERHDSIEGGSLKLPLSAHLANLLLEDTDPDDNGRSNGSIDGQLNARRSSDPQEGRPADQCTNVEKHELNSGLVPGDVSGGLRKDAFLSRKLPDQEDENQIRAAATPLDITKHFEDQVPAFKVAQKGGDPASNPDVGERSFSAASLISYSGQLARSGSVSMRSDGSTSARSFAFPILPSEWNSSPVRMAKADRRTYRKHRGWRSGFFCCGF